MRVCSKIVKYLEEIDTQVFVQAYLKVSYTQHIGLNYWQLTLFTTKQ